MARIIVAEACRHCGSLDVRAVEPPWFEVELERRDMLDEGWIELLEFECRDCRSSWT
jgi:hypothetical protein